MSDTVILGKTVSGSLKAFLLYALGDLVLSLAGDMATMTQEKWDSMFWMNKAAFWVAPIGSLALAAKMFYSGSAPRTPVSTSTSL